MRARVVKRSHQLNRSAPPEKDRGFFIAQIIAMETKMTHDPAVAIAGVTGAAGAEFIATMDRRGFG
jgi:hypothetical protein